MTASEAHRKGQPFKAKKESSTAASFYFQACCDGSARLGACVTLSQSPQHGFETWFSLQYAETLESLRVPLVKVSPEPMDKVLKEATQAAADAKAHIEGMQDPQGAKQ